MVALDFQTSGPAPNIIGSTGAGGGALGSILQDDKIQQDTIPLYQTQTQSIDPVVASSDVQSLYGTLDLPMWQWVRRVQTGEATYEPGVSETQDQAIATINRLSETDPELLKQQGIDPIGWKELAIGGAGALGQAVIGTAGSLAAAAGSQGLRASSEFGKQLGPAAKSFVSGSGPAVSEAAKTLGLKVGEVGVPIADAQNYVRAGARITGSAPSYGGTQYVKMNAQQVDAAKGALAVETGGYSSGATSNLITGPKASPGIFEAGGFLDKGFTGYMPSPLQTGLGFGVGLVTNLFSGMPLKQAVKSSAIQTAGTVLGTIVGGPIGGFIGGTIASVVSSGSVVCTELHAQGEISDSEYRITNYYNSTMLTPTHMKGYHFWGVPVAERMKKGKGVKFWKAVYKKWNNHASYKLGKGKFSLSGLIVAKSLETASLLIGKVYEATLEKRIFANG